VSCATISRAREVVVYFFSVCLVGHAEISSSDFTATNSVHSGIQNMLPANCNYIKGLEYLVPQLVFVYRLPCKSSCGCYGFAEEGSSPGHRSIMQPVCSYFFSIGSQSFTYLSVFFLNSFEKRRMIIAFHNFNCGNHLFLCFCY
jgi:hypothetical protein